MKSALNLLVASSLAMAPIVHGQENGVRSLSREDCLRMALAKNLDIRLMRFNPEFARINLWGDIAAWDPTLFADASQSFRASEGLRTVGEFNPSPNERWNENFQTGLSGATPWGMGYNLSLTQGRSSGTEFFVRSNQLFSADAPFFYTPAATISVTQPLLKDAWIDSARLQIQLDRQELKQTEADVRGQLIQTVSDVQRAYFDLISQRELVRVQEKALETAERFLTEQKKRVEIGMLAPLDEKRAESQVAQVRTALLQAKANYTLSQNSLKALIGDDFAGWGNGAIEPSESLSVIPTAFNRIESWNKALSIRPDIVRAKLELERQKIQLKFRKNQLFPDLDLRGSYGFGGFDENFGPGLKDIQERRNPNHAIGVRLSIPLSNRRERAAMKSTKLRNEQLLLSLKRLEQNTIRGVDDAIVSAQAALARIDSTKAERIYAEAALDAEQRKLENGKSTSFFVLELQRDLTRAQSDEIQAQSDYNRALVRLSELEGTSLETTGIQLQFR